MVVQRMTSVADIKEAAAASDHGGKRFSVPRQMNPERRVTIRPYESFRERKETTKHNISFGYAALSTEGKEQGDSSSEAISAEAIERASSPTPSIFSIYGDDPGPSTVCEQPVGAQADIFISSLSEKHRHQIKKFIDSTPPMDHQYFMWIKDHKSDKITVISLKTIENHINSNKRVRRVKWRHLSSERISIYRYSIPAITYRKSKACTDCIFRHKKLCLLSLWLSFVLFLCVVVVLGSLHPDDRGSHPYVHYNANITRPPLNQTNIFGG